MTNYVKNLIQIPNFKWLVTMECIRVIKQVHIIICSQKVFLF